MSKYTKDFLQSKNCNLLKQSAYSPDINLCDRMSFPTLEMRRSKKLISNIAELETFLTNELSTLTPEIMHHELEKLKIHCLNIIENNGLYV